MTPGEVSGLVLAVLSIVGISLSAAAWWIRQMVRNEIAAYTRPIQPGYRNGGDSLADVAYRLRRMESHLGIGDDPHA